MIDKSLREFPVVVYGQLEKYNEVVSKARVRIFYKGANRNGTFITDDFAEKLINSLPYTPVKGIFEDGDFTDHGSERTEGRIYGIVPENPNFSWEEHLDADGVNRTYACADVLIFTALYEEAKIILDKAQSMELYAPAIKYHEEIIGQQRYFVFDDGCFLGLQVLGKDVEPCFEGASFYALKDTITEVINKLQALSDTYAKTGGQEMSKLVFKLSDSQKYEALMTLLNPNLEESFELSYVVCDVYDDYALALNFETGKHERVYYSKDDENDSISISSKEEVYIMDLTENEKNTVNVLRKLNCDTYEVVNENLENAEANAEKAAEADAKIEEMEETIATLNTEIESKTAEIEENNALVTAKDEEISALSEENFALKEFKSEIEKQQKEAVISEYENQLTDEILDEFRSELDNYTAEDLDKELAYKLRKTNPSVFAKQDNGFVPKTIQKTGIEAILDNYKN